MTARLHRCWHGAGCCSNRSVAKKASGVSCSFGNPLVATPQEPTAQNLARTVSNLLHTQLRNVPAEGMLHGDVDAMTVAVFKLATDAGLLVFDYARNSGDNRSGTTSECSLQPIASRRLLRNYAAELTLVVAWMPASLACSGSLVVVLGKIHRQ